MFFINFSFQLQTVQSSHIPFIIFIFNIFYFYDIFDTTLEPKLAYYY